MAENLSISEYENQLDELYTSLQDSLFADEVFNFVNIYEEYAITGKGKKKYLDVCLKMLSDLADLDENDEAMLVLGNWYLNGVFVDQDYDKAFNYFEEASEFGNSDAYVKMGFMAHKSLVRSIDDEDAYKYLVPGAIKENVEAVLLLADMYMEGDFVEQDDNIAFDLYQKAYSLITKMDNEAKLEVPSAEICSRLAECYLGEIGTYADNKQAMLYISLAVGYVFGRKSYRFYNNDETRKNIMDLFNKIRTKQ